MENEKENKCSNLGVKEKKISKEPYEVQSKVSKLEKPNNSLLIALKPEIKAKPGFWSQKLQDLEKGIKKKKKDELYDFSYTDDSEISSKIKKKPRRNWRGQKKRHLIKPKYKKAEKKTNKLLKPVKEIDTQALLKKDNLINRERTKLVDEQKGISAFGLQATALTSTPSVNRNNLVNPSNFLFLSPIHKEETEYHSGVKDYLSARSTGMNSDSLVKHFDQETPNIETRLKRISCRRVLRSGRMLRRE